MNKRNLGMAIVCAMLLVLGGTNATAAEYTLKMANVMAPSHDTSKAAEKFVELVNKKSKGRIVVKHFPGASLGSDKETYEALRAGTLEIAAGSFANLVTMSRAFEVLHLPFIFDNRQQAHRVLDSKITKDLIDEQLTKDVNLRWLMTFEFGFRNINTTSKHVETLEDMKGLKLRASRSPTEISGIESFGGTAVTIDWPEVYNALRFGIVDGEAQPYGTMVSARHHEVLKELFLNEWQFFAWVALMSDSQWQKYPDWVKEIVTESAQEAQEYHRTIWKEEQEKAKKAYLEQGGKITMPTEEQLVEWKKAGRSSWAGSGISQEEIDLVRSVATGTR